MKLLNKNEIYRRKQVKYALAEVNILENTNHPFLLSLYFSFQVTNQMSFNHPHRPQTPPLNPHITFRLAPNSPLNRHPTVST